MPRTKPITTREVLNHILTICKIYECSTDKIARVEIYSKTILERLKKEGEKTDAKRKGRKCEY